MLKRVMMGVYLLALITLLAACGGDKKATYKNISVKDAYQNYMSSNAATMVDVRQPEEWATFGYPANAKLIPLPNLKQRAPDELSRNGRIYVICNSGNRSSEASQILIDLGYKNVYNVEGGIQAWLNAGLPVVPYQP